LLPVIQANKNAWIYSVFRDNERLAPDREISIDGLSKAIIASFEKTTIAGPGARQLCDSLPEECRNRLEEPRACANLAEDLISIAKNKNLFHNYTDAHLHSGPEYIRMSDAEINLSRLGENIGN
jgi:hypothetical protein